VLLILTQDWAHPAGPNLALELANALITSKKMTVDGAAAAQIFYNQLAAVIVAHIKTNALVGMSPGVGVIPTGMIL